MPLKDFQETIELGKLYKVQLSPKAASDQLGTNLFINTGSVDIYVYNGATEPTGLPDMILDSLDTAVTAINKFSIIPSYIAVVQNTGTTTELILSGVERTLIGDIS